MRQANFTSPTCDVNVNFHPALAATLLCSLRRSSSSSSCACWHGRLAVLRLGHGARCSWGGGLRLHWGRGEACPCTSMHLGVHVYDCLLRRESLHELRHLTSELRRQAKKNEEWHGLPM